jgi:hypothetical protein
MRSDSSPFHGPEADGFGFPASDDFQSGSEASANSADEVIGEMGLVLVVIMGIIVAINLVLTSLHIT